MRRLVIWVPEVARLPQGRVLGGEPGPCGARRQWVGGVGGGMGARRGGDDDHRNGPAGGQLQLAGCQQVLVGEDEEVAVGVYQVGTCQGADEAPLGGGGRPSIHLRVIERRL